MSKLTRDDVLKLARLARLRLSESEIEKYQAELGDILAFVEKLDTVDLSAYEPTTQVGGLVNVMRPDEVVDYGASPEELLKNVPDVENGLIKMKRMVV